MCYTDLNIITTAGALNEAEKKIIKEIVMQELLEIDEELATEDNDDIHAVVLFHIKHGIQDVEARMEAGEATDLEYPFGCSDALKVSLNPHLLQLEVWLKYYYKARYFDSKQQQLEYRQKILDYLE